MKTWPNPTNPDDLFAWAQVITRQRNFEDVPENSQLSSQYIMGRKTYRIPTASTDVQPTDREGDFVVTASNLYILFNNSGTLTWVRFAGGSF